MVQKPCYPNLITHHHFNPSPVTSSEQEALQFLALDDSSVEDGTTTELNKMMQAWDDDSSSTSSSAENDDEPAEASH